MDENAADPSAFYTCQNPDAFHADWQGYYSWATAQRSAVIATYPHDLALAYGEHPSQVMNVYRPDGAIDAHVVLYFHGGRWREGHPDFYDHLASPWVEAGAVFVSCGYRLAPEHDISSAVDDAAQALAWWTQNAGRFGADPHRITVSGHSAGGHLAAMVSLTDRAPDLGENGTVVGGVYMSAPLDLIDELPDDEPTAVRLSPARQVTRAPERTVISFGSPEPNHKALPAEFFAHQAQTLMHALDEAGIAYTAVSLGGLDHVGTARAFADPASALFSASRHVVFGS